MNMRTFFEHCASKRLAIPILGFPAVKMLGQKVKDTVRSAELSAEAICFVAENTESPAALALMDLSIEAEAFGANIVFTDDEIPTVSEALISDIDAVAELKIPSLSAGRIPNTLKTLQLCRDKLKDKPIIGGAIGPYSLAGRLLDVTEIIYLCYDEPEAVHTVLDKATEFLISYIKAQRDAGADGVLIAEPLAGILSPAMAEEFSFPYVKRICEELSDESFAVIYHNCGNSVGDMLGGIFSQGADAYHFGNASDMKKILTQAKPNVICMGNIDPVSCFAEGDGEKMQEAVNNLLESCGGHPNFIISSGCDIPPKTPWENVNAFFNAIKKWQS